MTFQVQLKKTGLALCFLMCLPTGKLGAQAVRVGRGAVMPGATLGGSISVTTAPSFVTFQLVAHGVAASSSGVDVTTTWTGLTRLCRLNLYAFFSGAGSALSGDGSPADKIPSYAVLGQVLTGSPSQYTPFTQSNPVSGSGASLLLYCELFLNGGTGSRTDTLNMEIDLKGLPQLPAGAYSGILYLQAQML
jgi:hypothetical protein